MHDLNNLIAQQSLIVKNAEKHRRNPDFVDDAIQTIANSVDRMTRVMDQLRRGETDCIVKSTELKFVVSAAIDRCSNRQPVPTLVSNDIGATVDINAERCTMVIVHLIRNAQDATPATGTVSVSIQKEAGHVLISVADTGTGMTPEFVRNRLFRPFDSTKGSQGMGIGVHQAREFVRKMGGDLRVESEVNRGTIVTLTIPTGQ